MNQQHTDLVDTQRNPDGSLTLKIAPPMAEVLVTGILQLASQLRVQYSQPQAATAPLSVPSRLRFGGRMKISRKELAEAVGISEATIYRWQNRRVIPYYKVDRIIMFDVAEVEHALQRFRYIAVGEPRPRKRRMQRLEPGA